MRVAALCSGYGGLELGLQLAGVDVELAWFSEIDQHAAAVMEAHHRGVPNLGDLREIHDAPPVELVAAGFPCQPVSHAGKRKGVHDDRWLIDDVCRIGREVGADWLVLENVAGIYTANGGDALARVVSGLAENGFAAEWTCVRASDVGAPHQRLRWFCIAYADGGGHGFEQDARGMGGVDGEDAGGSRERERSRSESEHRGEVVADTQGAERGAAEHELLGASVGSAAELGECDWSAVADADGQGPQGRTPVRQRADQRPTREDGVGTEWGPYADAIARWEPIIGRPAPNPTDNRQRLNPRFVEWMMGLDDGWVCDAVDARTHQLRILGNGVVPQQAAYAIHILAAQYGDTVVT